ncbi:GTPase-associated system all-helical protein GASH [Hymenobacter sp. BRD67]|uniref:GTPase-associated system all-helical protein GASH n=1 Tax=Hymenobacter sp. BRD67 TaxID=2675877 RepID=UPI00156521DA|nr:GTPase-associated system all-helical protein GASH [Hymenobacter sp. BRD67]QKG51829.1 hypothetical protein GKZ67_03435 [Hymenobacter sp. BRD67]
MERNEVFYDWLRAKLFEVEDDKAREEWLTTSVNELAEVLAKKPHEVRCYTLVALDANIPVDNSRIVATYEIVKKHWTSVEGKYPQAPTGILRGVILSALYQLGTKDPELCRIVYYTASGYAQFVQFGSEQPVIDRILREFGRDVEDEATSEWELEKAPAAPSFAQFKLKDFKLGSAKVDDATLKTSLQAAAGITESGYASYSQNQSQNQVWATNFAGLASAGITGAIEAAIKGFGESLSTTALQNEINKFFTGVSESLATAFEGSFHSLQAVEQRSKLLWWKETLYSVALGKGYREIDTAVLPVVMAIDLAKMLPDVTPVSVDYLLTDTYRAVVGARWKRRRYLNYCPHSTK